MYYNNYFQDISRGVIEQYSDCSQAFIPFQNKTTMCSLPLNFITMSFLWPLNLIPKVRCLKVMFTKKNSVLNNGFNSDSYS